MRIAYLAAGAAGMYCGSCLHDNALAAALMARGEDVVLAPIYTPIRTDERDVSERRVFFGGINAFLQQKFPLFRRTPRWLDGWLDHPAVLRLVASRGSSVDPAKLGDMTVSMLRGEEGNQTKELAKLVDWLLTEVRPDVVHLSNSMMLGLARMISRRCGPPVICALSGEDIFLEKLVPPHYESARELLRERAADVDAFTALNGYFADYMADYLAVPRDRIHVIPHGLNLAEADGTAPPPTDGPPRIGYLARICADKGLHVLVEACELLADRRPSRAFELHVAGYLGAGDRKYFAELKRRITAGPLRTRFRYHGEVSRAEKLAFLRSLRVMSTPTVYRESKGLPVLEAWACARPTVLPAHGAFPEMCAATEGGVMHEPHDAKDLADKLLVFLDDPVRAAEMGKRARQAMENSYNDWQMADRTLALYKTLVRERGV
ncbi:MAG: glycosyltransferase family 4 protein [Pirellulales bacterium]|nr:glycosyltransferase family 4 protein [Pirellulales bacterium]